MTTSPTTNPAHQWSLDREIVLTRMYAADRARVFDAWTRPEAVGQWFGPDGWQCHTVEMDVRAGGRWRFDFVGPDGSNYPSRIEYLEVVPNERIVFLHGNDVDDDPTAFLCTVTFDQQDDGKTVLTLRQLHPTVEQRRATIGFGAVEYGGQTLDHLAAYLGV